MSFRPKTYEEALAKKKAAQTRAKQRVATKPRKKPKKRTTAKKKPTKTKRAKKMALKKSICEQYDLPTIPCSRWGTAKAPTRTDILRGMLWTVFSKYIRERDVQKPCITCGLPLSLGDIQAGHYAPVGGSPLSLWFAEDNVNGEHSACNADFHGWHLVPMRKNMILRYGEERVEEIDQIASSKEPVKWDEMEYVELIKKYL